jgi:hypothetical protein
MRNSKDSKKKFKEFVEQKEVYYALLTSDTTGENAKELLEKQKIQKNRLSQLVVKLLEDGWASATMKVVWDLQIEKYRTIGTTGLTIRSFDKAQSIKAILRETYREFLPKNWGDFVPSKDLIFNPHKPLFYNDDGIKCANLFIKNQILSYNPSGKRIGSIDWSEYPNIAPLFENVFKTKDRMNYFINWLAYGMQTLSKTGTAIVSKGIQGTGKGIIYELIIQYMIGSKYTTLLDNEGLKSRFNGELENKLFVLANEIKADFREGNNTYEKLKMYITDSEIRFEEKNIKARTIPNFFNIWLHSNNNVPLQIQGSDRRYTVFNTKSKKLVEVSEELGYEHITDYAKAIQSERKNFAYDVMSIKYDKHQATTTLSTDEKELIYEASMSKIEVLSDKLKKHDVAYFEDVVEDFYQSDELQSVSMDLIRLNIKSPIELIRELQKQVYGNHIKNDLAKVLYKIFVKEDEKDRRIGLQFNKYFGKATQKWINGKNFKYRKIDSDKEVIFTENIPLEIVEPNGTIKNMMINKENGELTIHR